MTLVKTDTHQSCWKVIKTYTPWFCIKGLANSEFGIVHYGTEGYRDKCEKIAASRLEAAKQQEWSSQLLVEVQAGNMSRVNAADVLQSKPNIKQI